MRNQERMFVLIIAAAGMLSFMGCTSIANTSDLKKESVRPVKVVQAGTGQTKSRTYPGKVRSAHRVNLSFPIAGPIKDILVHRGQRVEQGDLLVKMDPRDYEVNVTNLEAQLKVAEAQERHARLEYQRVRGLFEHDSASKSDLDAARSNLDISEGQVKATTQALKAARLALEDTELRSPYAGIIADRFVEKQQRVSPGQPVLLVQGEDGMEVVIQIPETEMAAMTAQSNAQITVVFDALPHVKVGAEIKEFSTESDPQTQTFSVIVGLPSSVPASILPGMTANVSWVSLDELTTKIVLPLSAIVNDEHDQTYVWVYREETSTLHRKDVKTGVLTDQGMEILSGISPIDRVLVAGAHLVAEGQKVKIWEN